MDTDTMRTKDAYNRILSAFAAGQAQVLIGTQMIAKGHDFPNVTLVGVVAADTTLNLPDYRSVERTFQLITQVAGRAGRAAGWRRLGWMRAGSEPAGLLYHSRTSSSLLAISWAIRAWRARSFCWRRR